MICHDYITIQFQPFMFAAIIKAVYNNLLVFVSGKHIYPFHNLECKKVQLVLIVDLIALAHEGKIRKDNIANREIC